MNLISEINICMLKESKKRIYKLIKLKFQQVKIRKINLIYGQVIKQDYLTKLILNHGLIIMNLMQHKSNIKFVQLTHTCCLLFVIFARSIQVYCKKLWSKMKKMKLLRSICGLKVSLEHLRLMSICLIIISRLIRRCFGLIFLRKQWLKSMAIMKNCQAAQLVKFILKFLAPLQLHIRTKNCLDNRISMILKKY